MRTRRGNFRPVFVVLGRPEVKILLIRTVRSKTLITFFKFLPDCPNEDFRGLKDQMKKRIDLVGNILSDLYMKSASVSTSGFLKPKNWALF